MKKCGGKMKGGKKTTKKDKSYGGKGKPGKKAGKSPFSW